MLTLKNHIFLCDDDSSSEFPRLQKWEKEHPSNKDKVVYIKGYDSEKLIIGADLIFGEYEMKCID